MSKFNYLLFFVWVLAMNCTPLKKITKEKQSTIAFRIKPEQDLKRAIDSVVKENNITAGWVATCVGSLTNYNIRFSNTAKGTQGVGHFEIVSLVGTLSTNGSHVHISISDSTGNTIGGHLMEGCIVYTTAEIVLQATNKYNFERKEDGTTPWKELQVFENKSSFD